MAERENTNGSLNTKLGKYNLQFSEFGKLMWLSIDNRSSVLHNGTETCSFNGGYNYTPSGWDECFPTIDPHSGWPVMGALVYSKPTMLVCNNSVTLEWDCAHFTASRRFRVDATGRLEIIFSAVNRSKVAMPFLWASHPLFRLHKLRMAVLSDGTILEDFHNDGTCKKFFVAASSPVVIAYDDLKLSLETDQPYWGIWLNKGGWFSEKFRDLCCLGIEATNCCNEVPDGTSMLEAGQCFTGKVLMELNLEAHYQ